MMVMRTFIIRRCLAIATLGFGISVSMPTASTGELINFDLIQGKWTGFGWLIKTLGSRERARCTALVQSTDGPYKGSLELKCTTEQYELDGEAFNIEFKDTKATGQWFLRRYSLHGTIGGDISEDGFTLDLKPTTSGYTSYTARLSTIFKDKCNVSISIPIDSPIEIKKFDLKLKKC